MKISRSETEVRFFHTKSVKLQNVTEGQNHRRNQPQNDRVVYKRLLALKIFFLNWTRRGLSSTVKQDGGQL